jgi:26S proteasome regulatory subunit (ATPase 3-interacting protein)
VFPDVDAARVNEIDAQIATLRSELNDAQAEAKQLGAASAALGSTIPIAEIDRRVAALEKKTNAQQAKITSLRGGGESVQVSREAFVNAEKTLQAALKAWRLRKKMAKEIVDDMAESSGTKPSALRAELGIDDDADVGVDLAAFAKYDKPVGGVKRGAGVGFSTQMAKKK